MAVRAAAVTPAQAGRSASIKCKPIFRMQLLPQPRACGTPRFGTLVVKASAGKDRSLNSVRAVSSGARMLPTNPNSTRLTVLLGNDQEGWHEHLRRLLEPQGVQTLSARSGREALHLIESRPVHVAILDAQMPQLGGLQVVKLMREEMRTADPPAILVANRLTS